MTAMTALTPKRLPRWSRRADARPTELVEAALELFVARGYSATRLEDVAQRAGVSKGTIYLYFGSKEELMRAAIRQNIQPRLQLAEGLLDTTATTRELLRRLVAGWWNDGGSGFGNGILKLLVAECRQFPELGQFYADEVMQRGRAFWKHLLERGIARGEVRPMDIDTCMAVVASPLMFLAIWQHSLGLFEKPSIDVGVYLETYIDVIFRGIEQRP